MVVTLRHLLFVTLCFQVLNVESAEEEPGRVLFGCWPSNIDNNFLGEIQQIISRASNFSFLSEEHGLKRNEASKKAQEAITENPRETVCVRTWFLKGWTLKCTRARYEGLSCGEGIRFMEYSHKYKSKEMLSQDFAECKTGFC